MEIIKPGNTEQARKTLMFYCTNCGCVFSADNTEYSYGGSHCNTNYFKHPCPTCCHTVYAEEENLTYKIYK